MLRQLIHLGITEVYNQENDNFAIIRYHLVRGHKYCPQSEAIDLLKIGINDPHNDAKAFAIEVLKEKQSL